MSSSKGGDDRHAAATWLILPPDGVPPLQILYTRGTALLRLLDVPLGSASDHSKPRLVRSVGSCPVARNRLCELPILRSRLLSGACICACAARNSVEVPSYPIAALVSPSFEEPQSCLGAERARVYISLVRNTSLSAICIPLPLN